tara:strand:+ start:176 stop:643 length:468 start_codon:yes stop_codon:yes gene_type:complete
MNESLLDAREELKRLEHTIHVTLKYTRTVDVIRNALERLISIFDFLIEALLEDAKEKNLISSIPKSPSLKSTLVLDTYNEDQTLLNMITFYCFLRDTLNSKYSKREEYRRHVTLVVDTGKKTTELDIDNLGTCEKISFQYFDYVMEFIEGISEDD